MIQNIHIRKPDFNERFYMCRNYEKLYTNFNITVKYNKPITPGILSNALKTMIHDNPVMTLNCFQTDQIEPSTVNYRNQVIRPLEKSRFRDVAEFVDINTFDESILEQLSDETFPMNCDKPLWKIKVFQQADGQQYISMIYEHIFFDGNSGIRFQKEIAKALDESQESEQELIEDLIDYEKDMKSNPGPVHLPVTEQVKLFKPTFFTFLRYHVTEPVLQFFRPLLAYIRQLLPNSWFKKPTFGVSKLYHVDLNNQLGDCKTKFKIARFTTEEVKKMITFCKANDLKLTLYLHIIALNALQSTVFSKTHPNEQIGTRSVCAIDGRTYRTEGSGFIHGSIVARLVTDFPYFEGSLLKYMKYQYQLLQTELETTRDIKTNRISEYCNILDSFKNKVTAEGGRTIVITNLGKLPKFGGKYEVNDIYYSGNLGYMHTFNFSFVSCDTGLNVVLGYLPGFEEYFVNDKPIMDVAVQMFHDSAINLATEDTKDLQ